VLKKRRVLRRAPEALSHGEGTVLRAGVFAYRDRKQKKRRAREL